MDTTTPTVQPSAPQQTNQPHNSDSSHVVISKRLLLGVLFVMVAIVAVPITLMQLQQQQDNRSRAAQEPGTVSTGSIQTYDAAIAAADNFDTQGDYTKVAETFESFIATNPSADDKNKATFKLASAYYNAKDYDKAITWYEQLSKTDEYKLAALHGLAYTYEITGDKQKSVDYFNQAISFMKANGAEDSALMIAGDEQAIKTLQN